MKLDLSVEMKNLDGSPIKDISRPEHPALTLRDIISSALLNERDDERLSGQEKSIRFALATKIWGANGHPLELTVEEAALIKEAVGKGYKPIISGQVWAIIESQTSKS